MQLRKRVTPTADTKATLDDVVHLFVYDKPTPDAGGIENMTYWIARMLADKGLRVMVAGRSEYVTSLAEVSAVQIFPLTHALRTTHTADLRLLMLLLRLRLRLGRRVVFYSMVINGLKIYRVLRVFLGWRAVSFLHGNETLRLYHRRPQTLRRNILACDVVFANSRYTKYVVERLQPFANVSVVSPGIPAERYADVPSATARTERGWHGRKVVLILSRLVRRKGHATVIQAVRRLIATHPELLLVIAGRGGYRADIERMIRDAGIERHVEWLGVVPESDKPALYRACDVFCMPSDHSEDTFETEGFGIAFLEASAAGALVIGSRVGGVPDAIEDGKSGFLIEPGDVERLVALLDRIFSHPIEFDTMRRYAKQRALGFAWSAQVDLMLTKLRERIAPSRGADVAADAGADGSGG